MDNKNTKEFLQELLDTLHSMDYVKSQEVPNINLYMDQVTTFMETQLANIKRHEDDKILTKTMINNYAKNDLLPPPEKKKYSKEHVLTLLFIYYFKNILSINDIKSVLNPITDKYFGGDGMNFNMESIYNEVFNLENEESKKFLKDVGKKYMIATDTFKGFPEEDQDFLQQFSFICLLSYDVYLKKMIIESTIDKINATYPRNVDTNKKKKDKNKKDR
ncbi:DUF1836 domain-containing protein [Lachnobacterium bovis]|uniref:DUF1836 domain-containing protein n=1 Tax=Lachnobacterium bovis TaxID=140626 RepID=A0A1H9T6T7_9FIRM|nr:DUF1836 domain-containing protein [Lachnobacterium bovis]SER92293.1 protein of unknown function [Lachnobacterium bovis]